MDPEGRIGKDSFEPSPEVSLALQLIIRHCSVNIETPLETILNLEKGGISSWWQTLELENDATQSTLTSFTDVSECKISKHMQQPSKVPTTTSFAGFSTNSQVVTALPQDTTVSRLREKIDEMLFKYTAEKIEKKTAQKQLKKAQQTIEELEEIVGSVSKTKRKWARKKGASEHLQ